MELRLSVLAADSVLNEVLIMLVILVFSVALVYTGVQTWRGNELSFIAEHERTIGPWTAVNGSRRKYRTNLGAGFMGVPAGIGFGLVSAGDLGRMALGEGPMWWPWYLVAAVGAGMILASFVYLLVYWFFGVPDAWRPPCQRGWKEIHGRLVLVRPGDTPQEREERRPITVDLAYRDVAERRRENRQRRRRDDPWSG